MITEFLRKIWARDGKDANIECYYDTTNTTIVSEIAEQEISALTNDPCRSGGKYTLPIITIVATNHEQGVPVEGKVIVKESVLTGVLDAGSYLSSSSSKASSTSSSNLESYSSLSSGGSSASSSLSSSSTSSNSVNPSSSSTTTAYTYTVKKREAMGLSSSSNSLSSSASLNSINSASSDVGAPCSYVIIEQGDPILKGMLPSTPEESILCPMLEEECTGIFTGQGYSFKEGSFEGKLVEISQNNDIVSYIVENKPRINGELPLPCLPDGVAKEVIKYPGGITGTEGFVCSEGGDICPATSSSSEEWSYDSFTSGSSSQGNSIRSSSSIESEIMEVSPAGRNVPLVDLNGLVDGACQGAKNGAWFGGISGFTNGFFDGSTWTGWTAQTATEVALTSAAMGPIAGIGLVVVKKVISKYCGTGVGTATSLAVAGYSISCASNPTGAIVSATMSTVASAAVYPYAQEAGVTMRKATQGMTATATNWVSKVCGTQKSAEKQL